ncbi:hypothetical protein SFOMI_1398 [Sphingobium fuliginis]|uniref:Uncharacterized protein n=1 Tax=Sphingobium fuliginis (strain ATCC 27551) TaxID=336203 RepID=A0A292ZCK8_SPHSA|nr:hypothetical protein SFOMI_1398 [Sphingobium fuliginis]
MRRPGQFSVLSVKDIICSEITASFMADAAFKIIHVGFRVKA